MIGGPYDPPSVSHPHTFFQCTPSLHRFLVLFNPFLAIMGIVIIAELFTSYLAILGAIGLLEHHGRSNLVSGRIHHPFPLLGGS